nr:serine/threonine-protein kinase meng-po-like [Procambarus clarkii]
MATSKNFFEDYIPKFSPSEMFEEFSDLIFLASGNFTNIFLTTDKHTNGKMVLKCARKEATKKDEFQREFYYNKMLNPHPNITMCFGDVFEICGYYVFAQELAAAGDLSELLARGALEERQVWYIAEQLSFALEYMDDKGLVHCNVCLENILVFHAETCRVKLNDFGRTTQKGSVVKSLCLQDSWAPPEVRRVSPPYEETYHAHPSLDAWHLTILLIVCLTGSYPWCAADITDTVYSSWLAWTWRKAFTLPSIFKHFTPRFLCLLKRLLEPNPKKRISVKKIHKYVGDSWLKKGSDLPSTDMTLSAKLIR